MKDYMEPIIRNRHFNNFDINNSDVEANKYGTNNGRSNWRITVGVLLILSGFAMFLTTITYARNFPTMITYLSISSAIQICVGGNLYFNSDYYSE